MIYSANWQQEIISFLKKKSTNPIVNGNEVNLKSHKILLQSTSSQAIKPISKQTIIIHQDIYIQNKKLVLSRLNSILGLNEHKIHGRKCDIILVKKNQAQNFLIENHLMGFCGGRVFIGLIYQNKIVALAAFSAPRKMKYEEPSYYSTELLRYASLQNHTVIGGLDKIISFYEKNYQTDDLITMVDAEWSTGKSFTQLGFETIDTTSPLQFAVNAKTFQRRIILDQSECGSNEFYIQNRGNYKLRKQIVKKKPIHIKSIQTQ